VNLEQFGFQMEGSEWLMPRLRAMLADEMGLGKSNQAIVAARSLGLDRIVVVCPAVARLNWAREFESWWPGGPKPAIFSYDEVVRKGLRPGDFPGGIGLLILDEAHYLKTRIAKRTKLIYGGMARPGLAQLAERVWALTGTPTPNHLGEFWTHATMLWGETLSYWQWITKYCLVHDKGWGPQVVGVRAEMAAEFRDLVAPYVLRRRAADVLDLPKVRWGKVLIQAKAPDKWDGRVLQDDQVEALLADASGSELATLRRLTGEAKAVPVGRYVMEMLESDPGAKVLVFGYHKKVIQAIARGTASAGSVKLDGSTPDAERNRAIDRFQKDPKCRVFVGQIQACGTAINLTSADHVLFAELSWVPGDNAQALKRAVRIGQHRSVLAQTVSIPGSVDESVTRVLANKTRMHTTTWGE